MSLLKLMELSVGELAQVLGQSQPRVSRHVKILVDAGIATRRREGSWVFLAPAHGPIALPLYALIDAAGVDHSIVADAARLAAVRVDRAAAAERYFAEHAEQWDALRALHVDDSAVETRLITMLGEKLGRLVDLGTGTGRMIELLGPRASVAIGVDRSPEMLRIARTKLADARMPADLRQADVGALPLEDRSADTVVMHQVLHYLPAPEAALKEAARIVGSAGRLLIVDFAPHDREELRSQDAHARLGFSDAQISGWFAASGLKMTASEELVGTALTIKLWLGVRPASTKALAA